MEYTPSLLKAVQDTETEILLEFIRVCEENGLEYFAIGGTHLGAIRHDGFIPWDDDIDVGMMRADYERFLAIAPSKLKQGFTLQHFSTDPRVWTYFAKVRKDGTRFVESMKGDDGTHQGVFIDVMPFDKIPDSKLPLIVYRVKSRVFWELFIAKSTSKLTIECSPLITIGASIIRAILHAATTPISKKWLFEKLDKQLRSYNHSPSQRISSRAYKMFEGNIADVFPLRDHKFGSIYVKVPANSDRLLTTHYGNWTELPPKEQQINHAPAEIVL